MSKKNNIPKKLNNFVIFKTKKGKVNIDVFFHNNTLWLTQKLISELFEVKIPAISKHLKNIFKNKELDKDSVVSIMETTAKDGKNYKTKYYSLKAITAVGYRVNSQRAIQFRIWATNVLHEYIIKGFAIDDERLKKIQHFGQDYFDEMLERIQEIRLSERRFYQKITDIYALWKQAFIDNVEQMFIDLGDVKMQELFGMNNAFQVDNFTTFQTFLNNNSTFRENALKFIKVE